MTAGLRPARETCHPMHAIAARTDPIATGPRGAARVREPDIVRTNKKAPIPP